MLTRPTALGAKLIGGAMLLLLGACSFITAYQAPLVVPAKDAWKGGPWQEAAPADGIPRGAWWRLFGDPSLDALEARIDHDNPTLGAALARYDQAIAYTSQLRAANVPTVDAAASVTRNRQSDNRPLRNNLMSQPANYGANTAALAFTYEVDLWGRIRNSVAAGEAAGEASAADMENTRLSLQAMLAEYFVRVRNIDIQAGLLGSTVRTYERTLKLTTDRMAGGIASGLDVAQAQTQLSVIKVEVSDLQAQRALYEHAIASLVGESASTFMMPNAPNTMILPEVPLGLPSTLLQRRPDIAAAERRASAANARVGVARAAFFPTFSINPMVGYQNTGGPNWLTAPNSFWTLGPLAVLNVFDGGLRKGQVAQARAVLDQAGQEYRAVVLAAFQQVEDEMSRLSFYRQEMIDQAEAADAAKKTLTLASYRYREGVANYLEVVIAQATVLQTQRALLSLRTQRLLASIALIRALGGGWHKEEVVGTNAHHG